MLFVIESSNDVSLILHFLRFAPGCLGRGIVHHKSLWNSLEQLNLREEVVKSSVSHSIESLQDLGIRSLLSGCMALNSPHDIVNRF